MLTFVGLVCSAVPAKLVLHMPSCIARPPAPSLPGRAQQTPPVSRPKKSAAPSMKAPRPLPRRSFSRAPRCFAGVCSEGGVRSAPPPVSPPRPQLQPPSPAASAAVRQNWPGCLAEPPCRTRRWPSLVIHFFFFFGAEVVTLAGVKKTKGQCFNKNTIYLWDFFFFLGLKLSLVFFFPHIRTRSNQQVLVLVEPPAATEHPQHNHRMVLDQPLRRLLPLPHGLTPRALRPQSYPRRRFVGPCEQEVRTCSSDMPFSSHSGHLYESGIGHG